MALEQYLGQGDPISVSLCPGGCWDWGPWVQLGGKVPWVPLLLCPLWASLPTPKEAPEH